MEPEFETFDEVTHDDEFVGKDDRQLAPRRGWVAVLLSLFGAGIGHLYAGRGRRGTILLALALGYVPVIYLLSLLPPSNAVLWSLVTVVLLEVGVALFALVDAGLAAGRAPRPYVAQPYNSVWLYAGLIVLCLTWGVMGAPFLRERAFEVYKIPTRSMAPTITFGDRILVNKARPVVVRRGDMVVFRAPGEGRRSFIKRVIGLEGERVLLHGGGDIYIDEKPLVSERVSQTEDGAWIYRESSGAGVSWQVLRRDPERQHGKEDEFDVPAGHVFVLGDHRSNSRDSRFFGPVPIGDIVGVAQYLYSGRDGGTYLGRVR